MSINHLIRIVDVDFYMAPPVAGLDVMYSEFRGSSVNQVPIIRVFGSTQDGHKICTHVHGVFPYLYIPYDGQDDLNSLVYQMASNIDKALNTSMKQASSNTQHIYKISLVSAYPFYGYHAKQHQFLKIYLYNPILLRRLSNLLQTEAILGKVYQPHESHLQFTLQFMIDYNLHGMSNMVVSEMKLRRVPDDMSELNSDVYLPPTVTRISMCELEGDILADNIMNRLEVASGNLGVNPGIAALWEDERQRRRNKNEDSQIESCLSLKNNDVKPTNSHIVYKRALLDRLAVLSTDKDDSESPMNLSVYPAETPDSANIQNASNIEIHTQSSSSLCDSMNISLNESALPSCDSDNMNNTLDNNFFEILQDLDVDNSLEEDSILSQKVKDQEEDDLDLSMPMTTPVKIIPDEDIIDSDDDMWNGSFNSTIIPQLDGNAGRVGNLSKCKEIRALETSLTIKQSLKLKRQGIDFSNVLFENCQQGEILPPRLSRNARKGIQIKTNKNLDQNNNVTDDQSISTPKSMPIIDPTQNPSISVETKKSIKNSHVTLKKKIKLKDKLYKILEQIKSDKTITTLIDQTNLDKSYKQKQKPTYLVKVKPATQKRNKIVEIIQKNDRKAISLLDKGARPKFVVRSNSKELHKLKINKPFHMTIKYPNGEMFLYVYNKGIYPDINKCTDITNNEQKGHINTGIDFFNTLDSLNHLQVNGHSKMVKEKRKINCQTRDQIPAMFSNLQSLDGNCDSSSSEEEQPVVKRRRTSRKVVSPRYNSLPISISSSQKGTTMDNPSFSVGRTENKSELEGKCFNPIMAVKKQLNFCDTNLNSTIVEEIRVCNLTPNRSRRSTLPTNLVDEKLKSTPEKLNEKFGNNGSFFENNLTISEQYDLKTKFIPIEGTSNKLTPPVFNDKSDNEISTQESHCASNIASENKYFANSQSSNSDLFPSSLESIPLDSAEDSNRIITDDTLTLFSKPKFNPPTRGAVVTSLNKYNLLHVKHQDPYYSNVEDVTTGIEVGLALLKVLSKSTIHLTEFETKLDSINTIRKSHMNKVSHNMKWNQNNINNLALSFITNRTALLTPIRKSPSKQDVINWIMDKNKKQVIPVKKPEKVKVFIPLSQSEDDEDMNMTLTLSPYSPECSQKDDDIPQTPKSSSQNSSTNSDTPKSSREGSPTLGKAKKKKKIMRGEKTVSLRKSILLSQEKAHNSCQLTGVSINNTFGFEKSVNNLQNARAVLDHQFLTVMIMEMHIRTRGDFKPNPEYDQICAIFYSILNDAPTTEDKPGRSKGVIAVNQIPLMDEKMAPLLDGISVDCKVDYVSTEAELIKKFLELIHFWDPDIIGGYEIQMLSWGYFIDRAAVLGLNVTPQLGRIKENQRMNNEGIQGELRIVGRILLDVWRLMRHEISLQSYTFESIMYHILHQRVPVHSFKDLSFWWDHRSHIYRHRTANHYFFRVDYILELFDKLDLIGRTSELARLFGIQFYEVLSRGSQFRVESMMLRLAKPLNFIPVSPSVTQRANMKAPEYIPLVLEPESKLYVDPVVVLDFQSLYPSMIIAYNYCFSTCIGKVNRLGKNAPFEFGATQLKISKRRVEKLVKYDLLNFSPCGVAFVKPKVREGILPRMLKEILGTRLMVKNSMKENKDDSLLQKVLHNRQLGLKLIANVTYGYTAANFSGRMPSVEVGDSVVSKGRETLQRAIAMVDNTPEWGAKVVYGDTDSLFIMFPGRSKDYAFEVGKQIAEAITKDNPDPVKLKFEKVYQPCILQTKKRYVGYMYESPDQKEPIYEAKGIETVRRDGCPAVAKMLEKCLRLLFETKDVSLVKKYVLRQFHKIIAGRISIQDLTFAKEYRGASGYKPNACVPALVLSKKWKAVDTRNEPRRGERVPYVIINGPPGLPLIKLVRCPRELLADPSLRPNALYYITKVIIPPINRCFTLIGVDLNTWFNQMPRKHNQLLPTSSPGKKSTISQYFATTSCAACGEQTKTGLCEDCCCSQQKTVIILTEKVKIWEQNNRETNLICQSCTGFTSNVSCISLDCPVYYRRIQTDRDLQQATFVRQLLSTEF